MNISQFITSVASVIRPNVKARLAPKWTDAASIVWSEDEKALLPGSVVMAAWRMGDEMKWTPGVGWEIAYQVWYVTGQRTTAHGVWMLKVKPFSGVEMEREIEGTQVKFWVEFGSEG